MSPPPPSPGSEPHLHYGLDIETDTSVDGLDPSCSAVVAAAVCSGSGDRVLLGDEADILRRLELHLGSLAPGVIVTWNGSGFDLPFLAARAQLLGVPLSLSLHPPPEGDPGGACTARWGPHAHLDGYRLYRADVGRTLGLSCALKAMARLTGLAAVEVDRERIHSLAPEELTRYVASDARLAVQLVARRLPAASAFTDRCPPVGRPTGAPSPDSASLVVTPR